MAARMVGFAGQGVRWRSGEGASLHGKRGVVVVWVQVGWVVVSTIHIFASSGLCEGFVICNFGRWLGGLVVVWLWLSA